MRKYYDMRRFVAPKRDGLSDKAYIDAFLDCFFEESEARKWWDSLQLQLDGKTPSEVWVTDPESVIKLVEEAYVNWALEKGYNALGIKSWWQRHRAQLDGKTPAEVWRTNRAKVIRLAEDLEMNGM